MSSSLLVSDRIGRLNRFLLAFRVGLYIAITAGLAASPLPSTGAIVMVAVATVVPALPLARIRPVRVEVAVTVSLILEFVLWYRYGQLAGLTVLPLLSVAVAGLLSTRRVGAGVGAVALALHCVHMASLALGYVHSGLPDPPTMSALASELVLLTVVTIGFVGLGELLRGYQRELAVRTADQARLDGLVAEKDRMINSLAHELRTPLTGVIGFTDLLSDPAAMLDADETLDIARSVAAESRRLANIIDNFVVGARAANDGLTVSVEAIDVGALVDDVWDRMAPEPGWSLVRSGDGMVAGDRSRLDHVLRNLLDNAVRHGISPVSVDVIEDGDGVSILVSDAGGGPSAPPDAVFGRYGGDQSETRPGNIGLGLPTARLLAERMAGSLDLIGSAFRLRLPVAESGDARGSAEPSVAPSPTT